MNVEYRVVDEAAQLRLGMALAAAFQPGDVVFLQGHLGAGKTTLVRGVLRGLGYIGGVKSPTYTLVETYAVAQGSVYHFDLYRLAEPEELDYIGARDYFTDDSLCLIEWPEQGEGYLPKPSWAINIQPRGSSRCVGLMSDALSGDQLARLASVDGVYLEAEQ